MAVSKPTSKSLALISFSSTHGKTLLLREPVTLIKHDGRGIINTFGVYQEYYEADLLSSQTSSTISWIGTLQGFLLFLVGILTGPIFDRGYFRYLIGMGTFLVVFGMMMTSLGRSYYQIILAQGVLVGVGAGCLFVPSVAIVATYFTTKRALMTGITAAGGSIGITNPFPISPTTLPWFPLLYQSLSDHQKPPGGVIFPIVFRKLQPAVGFAWATRIVAFMALGMLCISLAVMRMRVPPPKEARPLLDLSAFKEATFNTFSLGLFLALVGLYFPFFYTPIYGTRITRLGDDVSFYLLPVMNAGSIAGRIIPGLMADRLGSLNMIIPHAFVAAILVFAWLVIDDAPGLWVFSALYGYFSGAIVSLPPTIVALVTRNMGLIGTRMGMSFTFAGFGLLIGNPIAGAILNVQEGKFKGAEVFAAVMLIAGAVTFAFLRLLLWQRGKKGKA